MEEKLDLIGRIQEVQGKLPVNTIEVLNILTRPDVIEFTKEFIKSKDFKARCQNYDYPWDCAKEAEAWYETTKHAYLGGGAEMERWCEPCRRRVIDNR